MASDHSIEDVLDATERAGTSKKKEERPPLTRSRPSLTRSLGRRGLFQHDAERFEFDILSTENLDLDEVEEDKPSDHWGRGRSVFRRLESVRTRATHHSFWHRMDAERPADDRYFDMTEDKMLVLSAEGSTTIKIPSLQECKKHLKNEEAEKHRENASKPTSRVVNLVMNESAALWIWFITMCSLESIVVIANASVAAFVFFRYADDYAVKLDFSFLAFAVIFPLTFLLQSTFSRREQALSFFADFKAAVLSAALMTLTVDWPDTTGNLIRGRLAMPEQFNANILKDFQELVQLVYQYLSMPHVSHARNLIFPSKQHASKRVRALQNRVVKQINDNMFDLAMHTEEMRKYGFPSGEASRLHQYHQFLQQRFEHLRTFKYYRTPQATRSFGRAYILILPWLCGPYFAWVKDNTSDAYAIVLAAFTFLIVFGLLNAQQGIEDPFLADFTKWLPGIDNVKLDFEMAVLLQTIEQYYANANLRRTWELHKKEQEGKKLAKTVKGTPDPSVDC